MTEFFSKEVLCKSISSCYRKQTNDTCPICRDTMESDEDWELTDMPDSEEIRQEIRSTLSNLTERDSPPCTPV